MLENNNDSHLHATRGKAVKRGIIPAIAALGVVVSAHAAPTTNEKIDLLSQEVEQLRAEIASQKGAPGSGGSGTGTTIGGYGELHYNDLDSGKTLDFHRFVLFVSHRFLESVRLFSELELEHSNTENGGSVELEQAYLEFDLSERWRTRAGLFLMPVGIMNETHEPPAFYGVERNPVETRIIPSTWWEGGIGVAGELGGGVSLDMAMTSGLKTETAGPGAYDLRESRQNVANAPADSLGTMARLRWVGIPGVELATSLYYQGDITQSAAGIAPVRATLTEVHAVVGRAGFMLKALYGQWHLTGGDAASGPATGPAPGADRQYGWYVEPSYKIGNAWGVFARYNEWDNQAGSASSTDTKRRQTNVGVNYWPHPQVVIKFDVQNQRGAANDDGINLGMGYMF
jgi:hypothetical protein